MERGDGSYNSNGLFLYIRQLYSWGLYTVHVHNNGHGTKLEPLIACLISLGFPRKINVKGKAARGCWPPVLFINRTHLGHWFLSQNIFEFSFEVSQIFRFKVWLTIVYYSGKSKQIYSGNLLNMDCFGLGNAVPKYLFCCLRVSLTLAATALFFPRHLTASGCIKPGSSGHMWPGCKMTYPFSPPPQQLSQSPQHSFFWHDKSQYCLCCLPSWQLVI